MANASHEDGLGKPNAARIADRSLGATTQHTSEQLDETEVCFVGGATAKA